MRQRADQAGSVDVETPPQGLDAVACQKQAPVNEIAVHEDLE